MLATAAIGVAPAAADNGKVLVFTGTAGAANPVSTTAANEIAALGAANNLTVDTTSSAADINAGKLAGYKAVVFVNSAGDVLDTPGESALQSYVQNGGGFVGIGQTAMLEEGNAFFDQLIGLTGAQRTTGTPTTGAEDIEFLDRVSPITKDLPLLWKQHNDTYYAWTNNPTGQVHTVARVRIGTIQDGSTVTNDTISRFNANTMAVQPQNERAVSWCRDVQKGRSFYTGLGANADSWADATIQKHVLGAVEWAAGLVRANCKATINSNYVATRLTPPNPAGTSDYVGEIDGLAMAKSSGLVFYAGRAVCFAGQTQITAWDAANVGLGCGTIHVWDPHAGGNSEDQDPGKITKVADLQVFGAKGGGSETGRTSKDEQGLLGIALDPQFDNGRPYIYVQYHPYFSGEMGYPVGTTNQWVKGNQTSYGPGFVRTDYRGERRVSRFTYDKATKTIVPGSEKVILHWMTQVFSCCHLGGSMDFDSKGNLYLASGDNTGNTPNGTMSGYTNSDPRYTIPCPGSAPNVYVSTGCGVDTTDPDGDGPLPARAPCAASGPGSLHECGYTSYADARQTSGNTNVYEGKLLRIHPVDNPGDTPGIGTTYTIPGPDAPNGGNLFAPDSDAVKNGKALPEVFAMGVRNLYSIDVDSKTDKVATSWVGPDQGSDSDIWGPAKTENAALIGAAGNYGWPYCQAGNRIDYRAKLPGASPGVAANLSDNVRGTVGGGADGQTGAFWDCRGTNGTMANDSPYNNGLTDIPAPKPTNLWYGPQGGCYDYTRNANGVPNYPSGSGTNLNTATMRRCPFAFGGSQAPMTAGIYRKPSGDAPNAWPAYWDGRWFLSDFAGGNNLRHALLMDPSDDTKGGLPVSADSLYGIIPTSIMNGNRTIDLDFGPDGDLYVASYSGSNFTISAGNTSVWKFSYVGGDDTPGSDPQATPAATSSLVNFGVGQSGGVSYAWTFDDGATATGANPSHSFLTGGTHTATLTTTYADGGTSTKTVTFEVPPTASTSVGGTVVPTLALTLGGPASFGQFVAAQANTYTAQTTANVISTAGNATLTVTDATGTAPGHLINGTSVMPQAMKARATNAANPNTAFGTLSENPLTLLTYPAEISNDAVTLQFQQPVAATDALRSGSYAKTLTFTLSTTAP
jgi:glucose/arabinose dehydrogenase